jgi:hypothetical protein
LEALPYALPDAFPYENPRLKNRWALPGPEAKTLKKEIKKSQLNSS